MLRLGRQWLLYKANYHAVDRRYERLEAVPTAQFFAAQELDVSAEMRSHITSHLATPRLLIQMALRAIPEPLGRFAFVDIGSGLGRALLVASEYPFRRVVGYEISPRLNEAAVENIECFHASGRMVAEASSINDDAIAADWPAGRCVIFMFNAFDREFTATLLAKIEARARRGISDYVILSNMKHGDLIAPGIMQRIRPSGVAALYARLASPYPLDVYRTNAAEAAWNPALRGALVEAMS
jgi:SAM-dependent methyltransferase